MGVGARQGTDVAPEDAAPADVHGEPPPSSRTRTTVVCTRRRWPAPGGAAVAAVSRIRCFAPVEHANIWRPGVTEN